MELKLTWCVLKLSFPLQHVLVTLCFINIIQYQTFIVKCIKNMRCYIDEIIRHKNNILLFKRQLHNISVHMKINHFIIFPQAISVIMHLKLSQPQQPAIYKVLLIKNKDIRSIEIKYINTILDFILIRLFVQQNYIQKGVAG